MRLIITLIALLTAPLVGLVAWNSGYLHSTKQLLQILLFAWPASIALIWIVLSGVTGVSLAARANAGSWSGLSKIFHWVMGFTILGTTALMYYMVNIGDLTVPVNRAEYSRLLKIHKSLGLIVLFLIAFRFIWNWRVPRPELPIEMTWSQMLASKISHHSLYLAMLLVPLIGWMASMTYGGRTFFFGLFELPVWLPKNLEWANVLQPAHIWLAWGMLAVVGVHVVASLWHHFVKKDATLVQMMPRPRSR
ncbi:MAG: cytochrome b [Steroidobacteraceae bacterium]